MTPVHILHLNAVCLFNLTEHAWTPMLQLASWHTQPQFSISKAAPKVQRGVLGTTNTYTKCVLSMPYHSVAPHLRVRNAVHNQDPLHRRILHYINQEPVPTSRLVLELPHSAES